ncbi:MAG: M23 family metallopeptidase [Pseudonocardiaceae bacterium]
MHLICLILLAMLPGGPVVPPNPATRIDVVRAGPDTHGPAGSHDHRPPRNSGLRYGWPLPGSPRVVRAFHPPASRYGPGHRGVDLAAVTGTAVLAAGAGTVVFAGTVAGHGVVSVDHPGGLRTTYEPVSPTVTAGDRVAKGAQLGTVEPGHPGCRAAACLHWGARRGPAHEQVYLDPLRLLALTRVRLLPVGDHQAHEI